MNEQISRQLREAAEAHRPDRARMLARVERGMASTAHRPSPRVGRSWSKVTLAGAAAAGILATAGIAVAVVGSAPPPPPDTLPPAVSNSSVAPSTTTSVAPPVAANQPNVSTPETPDSSSATSSRLSDGPLSAKGSVDPHSFTLWTQDTLVVETTQQLTALTVEVRIAQTGGVESTGQWRTMPADDFTVTVQEADGELVYRWDLKPGRTAPPARHLFAVQYNHHRGVRDGKADRYAVTSGSRAVWGGFDPA